MTKAIYLYLPFLLWLLSVNARADYYTCKDSSGHVITSDRPIPECADKSTQIFNSNGILKNQYAGALTPEQHHAAEVQQQKQTKDAVQQDTLKREQLFLISHYANENAIEMARKQASEALEAKITLETRSIENATAAISQAQKSMPVLLKNQPAKVKETQLKIDDLTQSVKESIILINNYRDEEAKVNLQYDATRKRYLEIVPHNSH